MHRRRFLVPLGATAFLAGCVVLYETRVLLQLSGRPDPDADRDFRFPGEDEHLIPTPDGGQLHVEECGTGRPVLLLHGHGASMRTFSLMAAPLAAGGCRVIALDQRGFGRSSPVPPMFGFPGLVDDAATVLEHLDLRNAIVVGHSMGGGVALGLAVDRPEIVAQRVAGIVLVNSSGRGPADRPLTRGEGDRARLAVPRAARPKSAARPRAGACELRAGASPESPGRGTHDRHRQPRRASSRLRPPPSRDRPESRSVAGAGPGARAGRCRRRRRPGGGVRANGGPHPQSRGWRRSRTPGTCCRSSAATRSRSGSSRCPLRSTRETRDQAEDRRRAIVPGVAQCTSEAHPSCSKHQIVRAEVSH